MINILFFIEIFLIFNKCKFCFFCFDKRVNNIVNFFDKFNKDKFCIGDKVFRNFRILFIFYVNWYLGKVGFDKKIFFINCLIKKWLFNFVLDWFDKDKNEFNEFFVVFKVL